MHKLSYKHSLKQLCEYLAINSEGDISISSITQDSRQVVGSSLFIDVAQDQQQSIKHIKEAQAKGASAVLCDSSIQHNNRQLKIPIVYVDDLPAKVADISNFFYHYPSNNIKIIGVTGTNGKTSCCWFIAELLTKLNMECAILGTIGKGLTNNLTTTTHTTLDQISLQQQLANWVVAGINYAAIEVSSHGLVQQRVAGISFDTVAFTNLTRDHLDYHKTLTNYASAKAKLFSECSYKTAIINMDTAYSDYMLQSCVTNAKIIKWSLTDHNVDVFIQKKTAYTDKFAVDLQTPWGKQSLIVPLLGDFNLANIITAIIAVAVQGYALQDICHAVAKITPPPGRMEVLNFAGCPTIMIDYAHTPDAIENSLQAIKQHGYDDLTCVFGCGGERDRGKRKLMLQSVAKHSNSIIITADNPRNEPIEQIIADTIAGANATVTNKLLVIADRYQAIKSAIINAKPKEIIAILGKGHETRQYLANKIINFNDKEVATAICNKIKAETYD